MGREESEEEVPQKMQETQDQPTPQSDEVDKDKDPKLQSEGGLQVTVGGGCQVTDRVSLPVPVGG